MGDRGHVQIVDTDGPPDEYSDEDEVDEEGNTPQWREHRERAVMKIRGAPEAT